MPFLPLALLLAQAANQLPPRDAVKPAPAGTAAIAGRVIDASTRKPIRLARIHVRGPASDDEEIETATNAQGQFELRDLKPGTYEVTASRNGYLDLGYGARVRGESPKPLLIRAGGLEAHVDFALPLMAAIAGRVFDEAHEPFADVRVAAMRPRSSAPGSALMVVQSASTDARGEYTILNLDPGSYVMLATATGGADGPPYVPTYAPAAATPAGADRVIALEGRTVSASDATLVPATSARVSGTAFDSHGRPMLRVIAAGEGAGTTAPVASDGRFTLTSVPPGHYTFIAAGREDESASAEMDVNGIDIDNLELIARAGWTLSARVLINGQAPGRGIRFALEPPGTVMLANVRFANAAASTPDGSLTADRIRGPVHLEPLGAGGLRVASITRNGQTLTAGALEGGPGETIDNVLIDLTPSSADLGGRVTTASGDPADATVLVFDAASMTSQSSLIFGAVLDRPRLVHVVRTGADGRWDLPRLMGGEYFAIAVPSLPREAANDPAMLAALRPLATPITVPDSGRQTVDLLLVRR